MSADIQFYFEGDDYFRDMNQAVEAAQKNIDVAIYYLGDDEVGLKFARLLIEKARSGVKVRLVYDAIGCLSTSSGLFDRMKESGIEVLCFNHPLAAHLHISRRDHRKLTIVDYKIGFFGGMNIGNEYSQSYHGAQGWRDSGVCIRDLKLVAQLADAFEVTWIPRLKAARIQLAKKFERVNWSDYPYHVVGSQIWERRSLIYVEYLRAIANSKKEVLITNPYFIPEVKMRKALRGAALRGVDVKLITTGPTDVSIAKWAGEATYSKLMKAGVQIFEYQPRILHAKSCVIDGEWFTVGSSNLNHLSFFGNLELNLFGRDTALAEIMLKQFQIDLSNSKEVDLKEWQKRSWLRKAREDFFFLFRNYM